MDEINSPPHYKLFPDMDVIDVIEQTLNVEEFRGYLKGNILKYRLRAGEKGPPEKCLGKAGWYRRKLDEHEANWPTSEEFRETVGRVDVSNTDGGFATAPGGCPHKSLFGEDLASMSLPVLTEKLKALQAEFRRRGLSVTLTIEPARNWPNPNTGD